MTVLEARRWCRKSEGKIFELKQKHVDHLHIQYMQRPNKAFAAISVVHGIAHHPMTIDVLASGTLHISASRNQAAEICSNGNAEG